MKKLFLIAGLLSSMLMLNAKALEFRPYVGINTDFAFNNSVKAKNESDCKLKNKVTFGLNAGSKINIDDDVFIFGEAYVNIVNKSNNGSAHFDDATNKTDKNVTLKNLFGFSLGFGYDFSERFNAKVFASLDRNKSISSTRVESALSGGQVTVVDESGNKSKFGFGLGLGVGYNIVGGLEAKLGYKFSSTKYETRIKSHMINLGLAYNF